MNNGRRVIIHPVQGQPHIYENDFHIFCGDSHIPVFYSFPEMFLSNIITPAEETHPHAPCHLLNDYHSHTTHCLRTQGQLH